MIEALNPQPSCRVLEIGAGTGYAAALLAQLAGEVVSIERRQILALEAAARLESFGLANVRVAWADGLALEPEGGLFDAILVHAVIDAPATRLTDLLVAGGALVAVVAGDGRREQRIVRLTRGGRTARSRERGGGGPDLHALGGGPGGVVVSGEPPLLRPGEAGAKNSS